MISLVNSDCKRVPLAGGSVDMIFTDPPYIKTLLHTYEWVANEAKRILKPGGFVAVMCGEFAINKIMRWFDDAGLDYYWLYVLGLSGKGATCWRSNGHKNMPIGTPVKHVLVYSKGRAVSRTATTGYYKSKEKDKTWHEWGQDVDSHRYWIDCFSWPGDLIVDPMAGGGTTAVACELLDRNCICCDIDRDTLFATKYRMERDAWVSASPEASGRCLRGA